MIAVSSPRFCLQPFEETLESISKHFDGWEIIAEGEHLLPKIRKRLREVMPSYNTKILVHAPLSDINIASVNQRMREESKQQIIETIKIARNLDIDMVTIHPGHLSPLGIHQPHKIREINKESIHEIGEIAREYGVTLALENMPKMGITICQNLDEILHVINDTDIKICFDIGHANTTKQIQDFLEYTQLFANIHLHDNNGEKDEHKTIGEGNIGFKEIIKYLQKRYKRDYIIESRGLESALKSKKILLEMGLKTTL